MPYAITTRPRYGNSMGPCRSLVTPCSNSAIYAAACIIRTQCTLQALDTQTLYAFADARQSATECGPPITQNSLTLDDGESTFPWSLLSKYKCVEASETGHQRTIQSPAPSQLPPVLPRFFLYLMNLVTTDSACHSTIISSAALMMTRAGVSEGLLSKHSSQLCTQEAVSKNPYVNP